MDFLTIVNGSREGCGFPLDQSKITLGRETSNTICLQGQKVSRYHAVILYKSSSCYIQDLNSSNGTYVNGEKISEKRLEDGDEIRIGGVLLKYHQQSTPFLRSETTQKSNKKQPSVKVVNDEDRDVNSGIQLAFSRKEATSLLERTVSDNELKMLQKSHKNLMTLYEMNELMRSSDINEVYERILDLIFRVIKADRGFILRMDEETGDLILKAFHKGNTDASKEDIELTISRTICKVVLKEQKSIMTHDATKDQRFQEGKSVADYQIRSAMCVPLRSRTKTLGIIHVYDFGYSTYSKEDLQLLTIIGFEAGIMVENALLMEENFQKERLAGIGQAVAGLAHYIKNILNGINGGSSLMKLGLESQKIEDIQLGWQVLNRSLDKISDMVMNMLNYAKEREPEYVLGNVNETVNSIIELMKPRATELKIELISDLDPQLPQIKFDALGIHRAVLNLVINAIDAIYENAEGLIRVSTHYDSERKGVYIIVQDNGRGIAAEDLPRIFNMFMSTKGSRGTGLGLPVTQKIVKEHKGSIQVQSKPNRGATFTIFLPDH